MNHYWMGWLMPAAALAVAAGTAQAQDPQTARGLAVACFTCHGTDGRSVGGMPPGLAGQNKDYLLQQMREFRDGKRPDIIMHQLSKGYTDAQLVLIAGYFSSIPPGPAVAAPAGR